MKIEKENVYRTRSGRTYPKEWERIYEEKLNYIESLLLILKLSLWEALLKPECLSRWVALLALPLAHLVLLAIGINTLELPVALFGLVGFLGLILAGIAYENERGMIGRLTFVWGLSVPLVISVSPLLALFIMGGNNEDGLGKKSKWLDHVTNDTMRKATSGRNNYHNI